MTVLSLSTPKLCECGCNTPVIATRREARYASDACRSRHWRQVRDLGAENGGKRRRDAEAKRRRRAEGVIPSDVRVSRYRMMDALSWWLQATFQYTSSEADGIADEVVFMALSPRLQRELEG